VRTIQAALAALGVAAVAYGAVQVLDLGPDNLRATVTWLVGGVLAHDAVLAPLTIAVWVVVSRLARRPLPGAVVVGAVVLGTVTIAAIPVLGGFGARPDNPTLLDRNYVLGWAMLATLTVVTVAAAVVASRRGRGGDRGPGAGGR
jgi:hypothetical protein